MQARRAAQSKDEQHNTASAGSTQFETAVTSDTTAGDAVAASGRSVGLCIKLQSLCPLRFVCGIPCSLRTPAAAKAERLRLHERRSAQRKAERLAQKQQQLAAKPEGTQTRHFSNLETSGVRSPMPEYTIRPYLHRC